MKDSFERDLKQKLEHATPEALGYRPDKDKLWNRIAEGKKKKTASLFSWITHAAAIAAGLLIGAFFLSRENKSSMAVQLPATALSQKIKIRTDTVYVVQEPREQTKSETTVRAQPTVAPPGRLQQESEVIAQEQIAQNEAPPAQPQEITVAVHQQSRKVLHLSDMANENAMQQSRAVKMPLLLQIFSSQHPPEENQTTTVSAMVRRQLVPAKN